MAIDTAQKRRSMISFGRMNYAERVPEATNFDSSQDRAQMMFLYAGLSLASPASGLGNLLKFWWFRRRHR